MVFQNISKRWIAILSAFLMSGCIVVSDANIKSIDSYVKPEPGNGLVFFSAGVDSHAFLGLTPSLTLHFSNTAGAGSYYGNVQRLEVMPSMIGSDDFSDDGYGNLYVLELPEGIYAFSSFHLKSNHWELWPQKGFNRKFEVIKDKINYAGYMKISISRKKTRSRIEYLNRFDRDKELLKELMPEVDLSLLN